ncbi:hypothetical protein [Glutamicibacter creatinolyticus]|uniref:hypothetical protein n=1 Tax=Glutamicibacter creatinolyticus TaxID=162496 RepID=UPI0031D211FF
MGNQNQGWREKYAAEYEEGKRQRMEQVSRLAEERAEYERKLKHRRISESYKKNSFKRDEPSHADLSLPKEDDDLW